MLLWLGNRRRFRREAKMRFRRLRGALVRLFNGLRRERQEREFAEELQFHLEMSIEDNLRQGLPPGEARRQALIKLGGIEQTKERCREQRRILLLETVVQDLRHSARMLRKQPGFTLLAVITLSFGIGANTAIFSLLYQVLLKPLPVRAPQQLVLLCSPGDREGHITSDAPDSGEAFSYPMYKDLREHNSVFRGLLARFPVSLNITVQGETERVFGELVSGNYFEVLGVGAASGRTLTPDDDITPGAHTVVVLSHRFWKRRFAADATVLNRTMVINGQVMTVVGVAQAGFSGVQVGETPDVFIPITMKARMTPDWDGLDDRQDYWVSILGRLDATLSREQAQQRVEPLYRSLLDSELATRRGNASEEAEGFASRPLILKDGSQGRQILQHQTREPLLMLMGMVGLILLMTCANLASLLMTRGVARQKEMAMRQALGASRLRLLQQLMIESLTLALAGGLCGLLIAGWTLGALLRWMPEGAGLAGIPTQIDQQMLTFNFALSLFAGLVFGLLPAWKTTGANLTAAMKEQGRGASAGAAGARLRKALVVAEVALTVVVLVAAGLFARSLYHLKKTDVGMRTERLLTFSMAPGRNGYTPPQTLTLLERLEESLAQLPGVEAVSVTELPVFANSDHELNIVIEGYLPGIDEKIKVHRNAVSPGYFSTLGVPLLAGREFRRADTAQSQRTVIINESLARRYFSDRNPLGRRLRFGGPKGPVREIVGVAQDSKHTNLRAEIQDFVYVPYTQRGALEQVTFYVRTTQHPVTMATTLRQVVARHDATLPLYALRTLSEQIDESIFNDRLLAALSAVFGLLAALLAVIGIYGVMSYTVAQRTQEIGIRLALGAQPGAVLALIVQQGMRLALLGIGIGLPAAFVLTRLMKSLLYGVSATDALTFAAVPAALTLVALLACVLPAWRAAKVDPLIALRHE